MIKIKILTIGKIKHDWLQLALDEYKKRLLPHQIEWRFCKNDDQLISESRKESCFIALDSQGKEMTTMEFFEFIKKELRAEGPRLTFIIGGPTGLPPEIGTQKNRLLSLSKLTFTHQMTELILVEQIYRILEIDKNSPYHIEERRF